MRFVLVHSPAVGPSTWRWVATALRERGHAVVVPDLVDAATRGQPDGFARAALAASADVVVDEAVVVVGHSGAGAVLPLVAARLHGRLHRLVFVDAGIPPCAGRFTAGGEFLDVLRGLAEDATLPRWSTWFGPAVLPELVPDPDRCAEVEADEPVVPLAFYETSIELPDGWCDGPNAYLQLSVAYGADADRAVSLGWPTIRRDGGHLDIVSADHTVADDLLALL